MKILLKTVYPSGKVPADFNAWSRYISETAANDYFRSVPGSRGVRRTYAKMITPERPVQLSVKLINF